jgi:8-oxo-dGTP diphosphatase
MPIPVVCAILIRDEEVMLAQRPEGKHLALKWEFPGGKVEPDELPEVALVREIREELGCAVRIVAALRRSEHAYERGTIEMIPFVCELVPGTSEPEPLEHTALAWIAPGSLLTYDLAPADYPVVEAFSGWTASRKPLPKGLI